jgi:hypothetical protein
MYSAEEVINALRDNPDLTFQGIDMIGCPRPDIIDEDTRCTNKPDTCTLGHEQKCKQHIHVFRNGSLLRIIELRFMRSPTDAGGFISRNDSTLQSLLRKEIISL